MIWCRKKKKKRKRKKNLPWYSLLCSHLRYRCRRRLQREYRSSKNSDGEGERNIPFWLVDLVYRCRYIYRQFDWPWWGTRYYLWWWIYGWDEWGYVQARQMRLMIGGRRRERGWWWVRILWFDWLALPFSQLVFLSTFFFVDFSSGSVLYVYLMQQQTLSIIYTNNTEKKKKKKCFSGPSRGKYLASVV